MVFCGGGGKVGVTVSVAVGMGVPVGAGETALHAATNTPTKRDKSNTIIQRWIFIVLIGEEPRKWGIRILKLIDMPKVYRLSIQY
ncbi:MAG: hypothetical protein JRC67_07070 [Deltaproteobacteria bacterium]|nr:hypothetical protein [Deltaproteobacteria bacterium]